MYINYYFENNTPTYRNITTLKSSLDLSDPDPFNIELPKYLMNYLE